MLTDNPHLIRALIDKIRAVEDDTFEDLLEYRVQTLSSLQHEVERHAAEHLRHRCAAFERRRAPVARAIGSSLDRRTKCVVTRIDRRRLKG